VPGIVEERHIGIIERAAERAQRLLGGGAVEVEAALHDETELAQGVRDGGGIVARIGQGKRIPIR